MRLLSYGGMKWDGFGGSVEGGVVGCSHNWAT